MGFIKKSRNGIRQPSGHRQQSLEEMKKYENIISHLDSLEKQMDASSRQIQQFSSSQESTDSTPQPNSQIGNISNQLSKIGTSVAKHNMVLEDLIETMEDIQKEQEKTFEGMKKLADREENATITSLKSSEDSLLKIIEMYQDQFLIFERASRSDPSWNHQFNLFRQKISSHLQASDISIIEQTDVPVNYSIHEVIERVNTDNPALNQCVADIFECGFMFKGAVKRKARISAYLCTASEPATVQKTHSDWNQPYGVNTSTIPETIHVGPTPAFSSFEGFEPRCVNDADSGQIIDVSLLNRPESPSFEVPPKTPSYPSADAEPVSGRFADEDIKTSESTGRAIESETDTAGFKPFEEETDAEVSEPSEEDSDSEGSEPPDLKTDAKSNIEASIDELFTYFEKLFSSETQETD